MSTKTKTTWRTVRLGDVARLSSLQVNPKTLGETMVDHFSIPAFDAGRVPVREKASNIQSNKFRVPADSVLVSKLNPTTPRVWTPEVEDGIEAVASTEFLVLEPQKVNREYLYYQLQGRSFGAQLAGQAGGTSTSHQRVRPAAVLDIEVSIPEDEKIQENIAGILSVFDEKIENNNRIIKTLEEMAQAIFKEWFVNLRFPGHEKTELVDSSFGRIPKGWGIKKINDIARLNRGVSYASSEISSNEAGAPMINLANFLRGGGFKTAGTKNYVGKFKPNNTVKPGQIVIAMTDITPNREIVGHPARIPESLNGAIISLDVCSLETDDTYVEFLYFLMLRKSFAQIMASSATGTNVSHLSKSNVEEHTFILPDQPILEKFNTLVRPIVSQQNMLSDENQKLAAMRDLLLPRLMSGEIRV